MNRNICLLLLAPAFVLTGLPAYGSDIYLQDLLQSGPCTTVSDPNTPAGCWTLQNLNSDGSIDSGANGTGMAGSDLTVIGSDASLVDEFGFSLSTLTQFTTLISDTTPGISLGVDGVTLSGDLTFNWLFTTADAGSLYDPAGYFVCPAAPTGFPGGICGLFQLTMDYDAVADFSSNPQLPPFAESGTVTVTLNPGDVFGGYVNTADNLGGAGTIVFSDVSVSTPEPASFLLIGGGLLALGGAGRKARRLRQSEKAA
jgi:PEP-CTERM motif-containing protein